LALRKARILLTPLRRYGKIDIFFVINNIMSENKTSLCQDLYVFELLQKHASNLGRDITVAWDPTINKFCGMIIDKRGLLNSSKQHAHLVKQIMFIAHVVENKLPAQACAVDADCIASALSFCSFYAVAIDEEECFYDVFVWCFLMVLNENRYRNLFDLLWRNQTFVELCLTAAVIFQRPAAAIRPLRHEVASYVIKHRCTPADAVYRISNAMRDTRLRMLDFLQECVHAGQKHEIGTIVL
jgi:hypothetical protein